MKQKPATEEATSRSSTIKAITKKHPAYACVCVYRESNLDSSTLFGDKSSLHKTVTIEIKEAEELTDGVQRIVLPNRLILSLKMTGRQWAAMASGGLPNDSSLDATIEIGPAADAVIERKPEIDDNSTRYEDAVKISNDIIINNYNRYLEAVEELKTLVDSGKANKTQLSSVLDKIRYVETSPKHIEHIRDVMKDLAEQDKSL